MVNSSPLSESEKQWILQFARKLDSLSAGSIYETSFLDPRQLELAESVMKDYRDLAYTVYGGHPSAERNVIKIFPANHRETLPDLTALLISWPARQKVGHRDLLGAIMSVGLKRDQIGDLLILGENKAAVIVGTDHTGMICSNLVKAGNITLECKSVEPEELPLPADDGKLIKGTVASLRLDAVISLGFGLSRSRVVLLVKGGLVRVNWRPVTSPSHLLQERDQISLRGRGRLVLENVEGSTRKGRIRLIVKKYGQ